jgi:5-methylcytosine-specific restriction endonuclease McrA
MGRQSVLTPGVHSIIVEAIEQGLSMVHACRLAGVSESTGSQWERQGKGLDSHHPFRSPTPIFAAFAADLTRARIQLAEQKEKAARELLACSMPPLKGPKRVPHIPMHCTYCHKEFMLPPHRVNPSGTNYCSPSCSQLGHRKTVDLVCHGCGKTFQRMPSRKHMRSYCSRVCFRHTTNRFIDIQASSRAMSARRRARKANIPFIEDVDLAYLYQRDKGICQICFKRCLRDEATNDHIIPISKGGEESKRNCVLAHFSCNASKGNRTVPQNLRLFG